MSDPDARWGHDDEDCWTPDADRKPDELQMATAELLELAGAVRGHRWRDDLAPALVAAQSAGWDWPRRARLACRLIFDPQGEPRSLSDASRDPVARDERKASEPPAEWRAARQALEALRAER